MKKTYEVPEPSELEKQYKDKLRRKCEGNSTNSMINSAMQGGYKMYTWYASQWMWKSKNSFFIGSLDTIIFNEFINYPCSKSSLPLKPD